MVILSVLVWLFICLLSLWLIWIIDALPLLGKHQLSARFTFFFFFFGLKTDLLNQPVVTGLTVKESYARL